MQNELSFTTVNLHARSGSLKIGGSCSKGQNTAHLSLKIRGLSYLHANIRLALVISVLLRCVHYAFNAQLLCSCGCFNMPISCACTSPVA